MTRWQFFLRAFQRRNYRLFYSGQSLSLIGSWMTRIATNWLVYRLTGSAWMLGLIGFLGQVPTFVLGPFAGVWVDRWSRHRTLVWTQVLSMLQSFALAALAFSGHIVFWHVALLSVAQGIINAFDTPARQAFLLEMVEDRAVLSNAIALNSTMLNMARLLGPAIGGVIIATSGEAWCFAIDGASYGAVILSLLLMHVAAAAPRRRDEENLWRELVEGFSYVSGSLPIRSILLLLSVVSLLGLPYSVLLPVFARQIFHGFGGAIFALGLSHNLALSVIAVAAAGFAMMQHSASANTILQTISEPGKRGRVMSYFTMSFLGMTPFGSLLDGAIAERFGAPVAMEAAGILCVTAAAVYLAYLPSIRRALRPIYVELGILPKPVVMPEQANVLPSDSGEQ